jgi:hypothetical protein
MFVLGYLDAGSGSLLLQAILGGLAGVAVAYRAFKAKVTGKKAVEETATDSHQPEQVSEGS